MSTADHTAVAVTVSVVSVCLNPGDEIDRTVASILSQDHPRIQWIVIDGGSRDGTIERLTALPRVPDILISEPDRGIADAMNKGIAQATGHSVLFMNAGDAFAGPSSLSGLVAGWNPSVHPWAYGDAWIHARDGRPLYLRAGSNTAFRPLLGRRCGVQHASAIVRRSLFDELGTFDGSFKLTFDYEFWVRCFAKGCTPQYVPGPVSRFYLGGVSGNIAHRDREWREARTRHGLSNPWLVETWLTGVSQLKHLTSPLLRRCRWAYRVKEALGW